MSEYICNFENGRDGWYEQRDPIVRCRDCQWFTRIASGGVCVRNGYFSISTADDGFCSKAERRDA